MHPKILGPYLRPKIHIHNISVKAHKPTTNDKKHSLQQDKTEGRHSWLPIGRLKIRHIPKIMRKYNKRKDKKEKWMTSETAEPN